jgi:hypothetical protein
MWLLNLIEKVKSIYIKQAKIKFLLIPTYSCHLKDFNFVHPSGYRYMVCLAISSYSFGATALIFCRMFIHIMEVCMSTGFHRIFMFFPKCAPNGILSVEGTLAYVAQNCQWLAHIPPMGFPWSLLWLLPSVHQLFEDCSHTTGRVR